MSLPEFDRPLSAGHYASIQPGTLVLDLGMTGRQIADVNAGKQVSDAISRSRADSTKKDSFASVPFAARQFMAIRAHEQDHFRRLLGTTFGFLGDSLRCLWLALAAKRIGETAEPGSHSLFPLMPSHRPVSSTFEGSLRSVQAQAERGLHTVESIRGISSLLEALLDDVKTPDSASAFWFLANGQTELAESLLGVVDPATWMGSAPCLVDNSGKRHSLTGRHLLEFFAIGEHANAFLRTGSELRDIDELMSNESRHYSLAILAWHSIVGSQDLAQVGGQRKRDDDLIIDWYRLFPFELYAAADLALWPPFYPDADFSIEGKLKWADIDPGRRFVRALSYFAESGLTPGPIPVEYRNERFLEIQAGICRRFGWPSPELLAAKWLAHLQGHLQAGTSPWIILDGSSNFRIRNVCRILSSRIERPADTVLNNLNFYSEGVESSPVWIIHDDERRTPLSMVHDDSTVLIPMMVMEGARHLFSGDRHAFTPAYPSTFRTAAIHILGGRLAEAGDWDSLLLDRFLEESHRKFRTSRD